MAKMDWRSVAALVAPMAPTLGKMLGGFIPVPIIGPLIGQKVGEMIAGAFGVPATPDSVANAINSNPTDLVIAKLQEATARLKAEFGAIVEIAQVEKELAQAEAARDTSFVREVNATIREEKGANEGRKYVWYVFVYLVGLIGTAMVLVLFYMLVTGDETKWKLFVEALPTIILFLTVPGAALGITAWGTTRTTTGAYKALEAAAQRNNPQAAPPLMIGKK